MASSMKLSYLCVCVYAGGVCVSVCEGVSGSHTMVHACVCRRCVSVCEEVEHTQWCMGYARVRCECKVADGQLHTALITVRIVFCVCARTRALEGAHGIVR